MSHVVVYLVCVWRNSFNIWGPVLSVSDLRPTLHSSALFCIEGGLPSLGSQVGGLSLSWHMWGGPGEGLGGAGQKGAPERVPSLCLGGLPAWFASFVTHGPAAETHGFQLQSGDTGPGPRTPLLLLLTSGLPLCPFLSLSSSLSQLNNHFLELFSLL